MLPTFTEAQNKFADSTIQLSISSNLVLPIYYRMNIDQKMYNSTFYSVNYAGAVIKPNYKALYNFGVQLKTKRNILFELQFQPYVFDCKGPLKVGVETYGGRSGTYTYYSTTVYETFSYTQNRYSTGMGFKMGKKRSYFQAILGMSFFSGTANSGDSHLNIKYYDQNGNPINNFYGTLYQTPYKQYELIKVKKFTPYINICYEYQILKRLSAAASINYCMLLYVVTDYTENGYFHDYPFKSINLLAFNLGLKYSIINKNKNVK